MLCAELAHVFRSFSSDLSASGPADPLAPAVTALAAAMLHLTLDTSASSARDVQDRLDDLAQRIVPSGNSAQ